MSHKPLKFQIVDYYDQDFKNEELNKDYESVDFDPRNCRKASDRSVLYWWNFVKPLWLHKRKMNYILYLFGRTDDGQSISVQVNDFQPYLYIKLPEQWTETTQSFIHFKESLSVEAFQLFH